MFFHRSNILRTTYTNVVSRFPEIFHVRDDVRTSSSEQYLGNGPSSIQRNTFCNCNSLDREYVVYGLRRMKETPHTQSHVPTLSTRKWSEMRLNWGCTLKWFLARVDSESSVKGRECAPQIRCRCNRRRSEVGSTYSIRSRLGLHIGLSGSFLTILCS